MISMQLTYTIFLAVIASSVSILVWVWFWTRKQDLNNKSAIFVFVGGAIAVILTLLFHKTISVFTPVITPTVIILWATMEEIFKLFVVLCAIKFFKIDRTNILIYMIIVALGFSALENVLFIIGPLIGKDIALGVLTANLRLIGANIMHIVSSGAIGISLAFTFYKSKIKQLVYVLLALFIAIILHSSFNLAITHQNNTGVIIAFLIAWILALILVCIVFKKDKKIPKKEIGVFILIVTLFILCLAYIRTGFPNAIPEILKIRQRIDPSMATSNPATYPTDHIRPT